MKKLSGEDYCIKKDNNESTVNNELYILHHFGHQPAWLEDYENNFERREM